MSEFEWEGWRWGSLARLDENGEWVQGAQHLVATVEDPEWDFVYKVACGRGPRTGREDGFDFIATERCLYGRCSICRKKEAALRALAGGEEK